MTEETTTKRQRKNARLWQAYTMFATLLKEKNKFENRLRAIEQGHSNLNADFERELMEAAYKQSLQVLVKPKNKSEEQFSVQRILYSEASSCGMIWDWLLSIKGLSERLSAQLLALVDDPGAYDTISKLWRHAGYGVFEYWVDENGKVKAPYVGRKWNENKGEFEQVKPTPKPEWRLTKMRDRGIEGYALPYNKQLKALLWNITYSFIMQQTPIYSDIYYQEKERQAMVSPELTKGHIDNRARRKVSKIFLQHLWLVWRECEGLPVTKPYVHDVMGHTHYVAPPNWPL